MVAEFELSFAAIRPGMMGMEVADRLNIGGDEPVVHVLHKSVVMRETSLLESLEQTPLFFLIYIADILQ
eukprot:6182361-Pleurochrysis_carterae.AAC.1